MQRIEKKVKMPGVSGEGINSNVKSLKHSDQHRLLVSRQEQRVLKSKPSNSPGKSHKRKMALPKRILRLLDSGKRPQFQNASLNKKRQMCINQCMPGKAISIGNDALQSCQAFSTKKPVGDISSDVKVPTLNSERDQVSQGNLAGSGTLEEKLRRAGESGGPSESGDSVPQRKEGHVHPLKTKNTKRKEVVAIDCEMVGVGPRGSVSALARCSIVDYNGGIMYDQFVKPDQLITDFRTRWSGVRPANMTHAISFRDAQEQVKNILRDKIVVGHAIFHDFKVLCLRHPPMAVRDTSTCQVLLELFRKKYNDSQVSSLKALSKHLLDMDIQTGEHSSVQDAQATMKLYRLVDKSWEEELGSIFPDEDIKTSFLDDHFWPDDLFEGS